MKSLQLQNLRSVLCIGAHPDDIEIGCGATMATLVAARPDVHVDWVVFSGDACRAREAEECAGCWLEGCSSKRIQLEQFEDGFFPAHYASVKRVMQRLAHESSPDLVFTHRLEDRHQDHRVLSELTWNAFRNHLILEYEIPKYEGDLGRNNLYVPIDPAVCELKVSRLLSHFPSQSDKYWFDIELFRGHMRLRGMEAGGEGRYAEAFYSRKCQLSF